MSLDKITAPFTAEQVIALNRYQHAGWMHPFTCGRCRDAEPREIPLRDEHLLVATTGPQGWICPTCDYTQDWAHEFMTGEPPAALRDLLGPRPAAIDAAHLEHQARWSRETFGPGTRTFGVLDHIRKELDEIALSVAAHEDPLPEWVDVIILAFDGAWRCGADPQEIIDAVKAKQALNEGRTWPDWRTMSPDLAIEHDRSADADA